MARVPNDPQEPAPPEARPRNLRVIETNVRYDLATERRLLASLVADVTIWPAVEGVVRPEHFHDPANQHVFAAIEALHGQGRNPWPPQVIDELRQSGLLEAVGGAAAVNELGDSYEPGSRQRALDDARLVAHYARARSSLRVVEDLREAAGRADHDAFNTVLQRATEQLAGESDAGASWMPVDTAALLEGDLDVPRPIMLERADGEFLLYAGKTHAFNAEPESGKSFLSVWTCGERIWAGEHALYIDFEDDKESVHERLLAVGVTRRDAAEYFHYVRPEEAFGVAGRAHMLDVIKRFRPTLVIIDGVAEAMAISGWDENSNTDVAAFLTTLPRFFESHGMVVVLVDHVVKNKESQGRYGRGGAHKLAGVHVAYKFEVIRPLARGEVGLVRITVMKDRPGWIRRISPKGKVAEMEVTSTDNGGQVVVELKAPAGIVEWDGPTHCMEAITAFLQQRSGEEFSRRRMATELRSINLSYREDTVGEALGRLVAQRRIQVRNGSRNSTLYSATSSTEATHNDESLLSALPTNEKSEEW